MKINPLIAVFVLLFVSIASYAAGFLTPRQVNHDTPNCPIVYGAITNSQFQAVVDDNVKLNARLKQAPTLDTSVVSPTQLTQAYADNVSTLGITAQDLTTAGGNALTAIQNKLASQSQICNNPNSTAVIPKGNPVAAP